MDYPLLQVIVVPIIAAVACALLGRRLSKNLGWIVFAVLLYTSLLMLKAGMDILSGKGPIYEEYRWTTTIFDMKFSFLADGLSLPVALIMNVTCAICAIFSIKVIEHRVEELYGKESKGMYSIYFSVYLLFVAGLIGISLSANLILIYLFMEMVIIPLYVMLDMFAYIDRHRVAMMYFIWNHVGAAMFLIGIALAFSITGNFEISSLRIASHNPMGFWICTFMLIGWLIKMATFGFHVWLPYAHGEHPVAAIIAIVVGLGNYILVRLLYMEMLNVFKALAFPLLIIAIITIIYGAFLTLAQDDVKRLYAASTISQTAYSILGIATLTSMGIVGGVFYFLSHVLGKSVLLSVAGILICQTGLRDIRKMGGLAKKMPLTATLSIMGAMVLSAFPPLSGFQAEWIMFVGVFKEADSIIGLIVALVAIFATFLTVIYTFWPALRIFFGPLPKELEDVKEAPPSMTIPLFFLMLMSFIMGICPGPLIDMLSSVIVGS